MFLSCVSSNNLFNVLVALERFRLIVMQFRSCRMVCIQVVFGPPFGLFTLLKYSLRTFLAGVSGWKGLQITAGQNWCNSQNPALHF